MFMLSVQEETTAAVDTRSLVELLQALCMFMEQSTVGEFSVRLEIILAFHCHLMCTAKSRGMISMTVLVIQSMLIICIHLELTHIVSSFF